METNYTLKRLKLFGTVFAALFAVLLLSSFKAEAQTTVAISGQTEFCNYPVVPIYTATLSETMVDPQFAWYFSTTFGVEASGGAEVNQFAVRWNRSTCDTLAWVYVEVRDGTDGPLIKSDTLWIYIYDPVPDISGLDVGPFFGCADAVSVEIESTPIICGVTTGTWTKVAGPGMIYFEDEHSYITDVFPPVGEMFEPGVYTLTWTIENGACTSSTFTTTLTIHPLPEVYIDADGPVELCFGGSVDLVATVTNVATFQWYRKSTPPALDVAVGIDSDTYTVTQSGTYYVMVEDENECQELKSNEVTVAISELFEVEIDTEDPLVWHWDDAIDVTFTSEWDGDPLITSDVIFQWYMDGEAILGADTDEYNYTLAAASAAEFGEIKFHLEITEYPQGEAGIASCTYISNEIIIEIVPPIHAMFNPSYIAGDDIARPDDCLENIPIDTELWIEFSQPVFTINGEDAARH
jgi:hypothetical protein